MKKQNDWGGKRKGAGRPPLMSDGKRVDYYLPQHVREWIRNNGGSQAITKLVEEKIKQTPA